MDCCHIASAACGYNCLWFVLIISSIPNLFLSAAAIEYSYDFSLVPQDAVVFNGKAADAADRGVAFLNCAFDPPFHLVSWQYLSSQQYHQPIEKSRLWLDVFIDGKLHVILPNNSLQVSAWQSGNESNFYRCIGSIRNWGSVISPSGEIKLAVKPFQTSKESWKQLKEYEGGLLKLFCPLSGTPDPKITWFRDDNKLYESSQRISMIDATDFTTAALEIANLQIQDQGVYSCTAENVVGSQKVNIAQVDVIKGHTSESLQFFDSPANVSALVGEDVLLQCAARGFPTSIKYTWYRDSIPLQENEYSVVGSGNIKLTRVDLKDTGSYKCIATVGGMVEAKSQSLIHLQINEAPKFDAPTSKFERPEGEEEGSVVLECPVTAYPAPSVSWYVDKKPLKADGIYFVQEPDSLRIYGLLTSDSNVYECIAENDFGSIYRIFQLHVKPKTPVEEFQSIGEPNSFKAEASSITSITLSWSEPNPSRNFDIVRYLVSYYERNAQYARVKKVTTLKDKKSLEINNLQEDTTYLFKVQAVDSSEKFGRAATTFATTLKRVLVGDIMVSVEKVEETNALIKWNVASVTYKDFQVEYANSCFSKTPTAKRITTTSTTYLLLGLEESCTYNVTVSSINDQGQVGIGMVSFVTAGTKPSSSPMDVRAMGIDPTEIEVWWSKVPIIHQNAKITSYLVRYRPEKLKSRVNTAEVRGKERLHVILENLEKNTVYQVAVAAANIHGDGPYSDWITAQTLNNKLAEDRVPGKVEKLSVVDVTENSITIKWGGTENGSTIRVRSYVLYIDEIVPINVYAEVPATEERFTFTNLKRNKNYIIKVAAKNDIGTGPDSHVFHQTTEAPIAHDMPLQMPNNVSVKAVSFDTLQVHFTSNNPTKDDSWFKVRVKWRYPTVFIREFECRPPLTSCLVTGLRPGTEYEIDVRAYRGHLGEPSSMHSPWSMAALGTTLETIPGSPPTGLTASPVKGSPNNVLLMWIAPKEPNGKITGYDLSYTTDPTAKDWALEHVLDNVLSHEVKDLTLQTDYYFRIAARNKKGLGPVSEVPVKYTTPIASPTPNKKDSTEYDHLGTESNGGLEKEYLYIMIAAVVGITVIIVCLIIAFVVCRIINHQAAASIVDKQSVLGSRPDSNMTQQGSLYSKQGQLQQPDITDLYVHKDNIIELKAGKESVTYMPPGSYRLMDNFSRSASPPDIQKQLMTSNMSRDSPSQGYFINSQGIMTHPHMSQNPSPAVHMQLAHDFQQQQQQNMPPGNLVRPTPVRMGTQLPPPLHQHPHSMHSELPMMAIKPMFMQANNNTPPPISTSPANYNSRNSTGPYKHYESDTPTMGDYTNGSDTAVYSPPSSLSGGRDSRDGSLGRTGSGRRSNDKALKALPAMPPELKPLSSLNSTPGLPSMSPTIEPHMAKVNKAQNSNLPLASANNHQMVNNVPTSSYRQHNPNFINQNNGPHPPSESYAHSAMQQEADACVDRIAGLMNRLNSQNAPTSNYPLAHGRIGEMDC